MDHVNLQPRSVEAEQNILGIVINNPDDAVVIIEPLKADHFYSTANKTIWESMIKLMPDVNMVNLIEDLDKSGQLEAVGGAYFITELTSAAGSLVSLKASIDIVIDNAKRRGVIKRLTSINKMAY